MRTFFFAASWLLALLCGAFPASAVMTRQDMIDLRERSLESLRKGDSAAAYAGYLRLLREDPGNADNDFMLGQVAFAQGKYPMAVLAYLRVIKASPGHERARLELARTYAQMGQLELSRAELAALRAIKPDLPPADEMEKSLFPAPYSPWTIQATLGAGLFYDSNANTGTSASEYLGYSLEDGRQRESFGAYFSGGLDVAYRLSKETNWYLVGDVSATNRQYFNASVDSRLTWGRAALGLRWASDKVLAEIRGKGEYLGRANSEVTQNVGAEAAFMYALTENWTLVTQSAYEYRHYAFDYKAMRGTHGQVGQYVRYQFGESRHELLLGGVYFIDRAHEKRYDGQGAEVLGRIVFHLPWQVKAGVFAAWHSAWYDAPPTDMGGAKRREEQFKGGLELEKGITKGLSVNAQAQYTKNFSNHALYRYDQWLLTTGLTYKF